MNIEILTIYPDYVLLLYKEQNFFEEIAIFNFIAYVIYD